MTDEFTIKLWAVRHSCTYFVYDNEAVANYESKWITGATDEFIVNVYRGNLCSNGFCELFDIEDCKPGTVIPMTITLGQPYRYVKE